MALTLTVGGSDIPIDAGALKGFDPVKALAFALAGPSVQSLNTPLNGLPADFGIMHVAYTSPAASWNPPESPVTFGLQGGASGSFEVLSTGALLSYTDGLESQKQVAISVPEDTCYTRLTLSFNISANASGAYSGSGGLYGVKASLDTRETYALIFCKRVPATLPLRDAIAQTFESFVLPLHAKSLEAMGDGDYLLHEFDGSLHLGFGAYAGVNNVLYCGQSSADVLRSFGSPLASVHASASPTASLKATLDLSFKYESRFEALLSRDGATGRLHLFRSSTRDTTTTLKAGLTFDGNVKGSISTHMDTLKSSVRQTLGTQPDPGFDATWTTASGELQKYTDEANDKIASWLNRANGIQTNLELSIEQSHSRTLLLGYVFTLADPTYPAAWSSAMAGDFVTSVGFSAVALDQGSGLEQMYQSRTSIALHLFNVWHCASWSEFFSKSSLVYAGNNRFHLTASIGRQTETDSVGAMRTLDLHFSAQADQGASGTVSDPEVDLHLDLTSKGDKGATKRMAALLNAAACGPNTVVLVRELLAFASNAHGGTAQLQITIPQSAYAALRCDPYVNARPTSSDTTLDRVNWNAFATACNDLNAWPLNTMSTLSNQDSAHLVTFAAWAEWNAAANGTTASNRRHPGDTAIWPDDFPHNLTTERALVTNSLFAGQQFMNFCDDLVHLFALADGEAAAVSWSTLLAEVTNAIKLDSSIDFARPSVLALIRLCKRDSSIAAGPLPPAVPKDHLCITITV